MTPAFVIVQKAFIVNTRSQALILNCKAPNQRYETWDLPGGKLDHSESLRTNLIKTVGNETGLNVTTVSIPLNLTTYIKDDRQIVRIIYLCRAQGNLDQNTKFLWIDPVQHSQFSFPDEGYSLSFENYLSHSEIATVEFLGSGFLTQTNSPDIT